MMLVSRFRNADLTFHNCWAKNRVFQQQSKKKQQEGTTSESVAPKTTGDAGQQRRQQHPKKEASQEPKPQSEKEPISDSKPAINTKSTPVATHVAERATDSKIAEESKTGKKLPFFVHLSLPAKSVDWSSQPLDRLAKFDQTEVHPAFVRMGVKYSVAKSTTQSNEHCWDFLSCTKELLQQCRTSTEGDKPISIEAEIRLKQNLTFLENCAPIPICTANAIKFVKSRISSLSSDDSNEDNLQLLLQQISEYQSNRVELSSNAIVSEEENISDSLKSSDNILIYGYSSIINKLLTKLASSVTSSENNHKSSSKFSVTIIDSSPNFDGRKSLKELERIGVKCSYGLLSALSFFMPHVDKVLIDADALFGNGAVMAKAGSGSVMLSANFCNKPVIVCCETFKFSEKIQTDSIVFNQLADAEDVLTQRLWKDKKVTDDLLDQWKSKSDKLSLLNCVYDVTPPSFVTMVISELGNIPSLSVPIIYRWKCKDLQDFL